MAHFWSAGQSSITIGRKIDGKVEGAIVYLEINP